MNTARRQELTYHFGLFDEISFSKEHGWRRLYRNFKYGKDDDLIECPIEEVKLAFQSPWTCVKIEATTFVDRR